MLVPSLSDKDKYIFLSNYLQMFYCQETKRQNITTSY